MDSDVLVRFYLSKLNQENSETLQHKIPPTDLFAEFPQQPEF